LLSGASFPGSTSHLQSPSFIAPNVPADDVLTFELIVRDNILQSDSDRVSINVNNVDTNPANIPPTDDAGDDITSNERSDVFLDGTRSEDVDGATISFSWKQISGTLVQMFDTEFPGDSSTAQSPLFTAPEVNASGEELVFKLTVRDDDNEIDIDYVNVIINNVDVSPTNTQPKAKAGADQIIHEGSLVILDERDSYDPDGDTITYSWNQTDDTGITPPLSNVNSAVTSFAAPLVDSDVTLTFQLTVNDGTITHSDGINIIISDVSGSSTLPLIQNPFPDGNDDFGYVVSGNDGITIVGTPFEDLVEFPNISSNAETESMVLSNLMNKKTFSIRESPDNTITYLADMNNPNISFAVRSFSVEINSDDLMSLNLFTNYTTGLLSLADSSGNILADIHDVTQQNNIATLGHTINNGIIAFTSITTNSTILFDGTSGVPLAQVAQNAGTAYLYDLD